MAEITKSLKETAGKITGGLGRGLSKLSSVFKSNKIEPAMSETSGSMSNTQYLGSIYQLMVDSDEDRRLEYEREQNIKEESDSEEQRQHQEIIKALTLRRKPKPKRVIRREKEAEKKAKASKPTKKVESPKKEAPKTAAPKTEAPKTEAPKTTAPKTTAPKTEAPKTEAPKTTAPKTEAPKKEAPKTEATKKEAPKTTAPKTEAPKTTAPKTTAPKTEAPKTTAPKTEAPKTAEPVKQTPKQPAPKPAEPVKAPQTVKPQTATQKPPAPSKPNVSTAEKIGTGVAIATTAALTGKEALAANIAKYESTGSSGRSFGGDEYNAYNKGTVGNKMIGADKPIDFSKMTITEYLRRGSLDVNDPDRLFAVGRYQIIPKTMENLIKNLKIDPDKTTLNRDTQDMLFAKGLTTSIQGRTAVDNYIKGKPGVTRDDAIMALAKEFASVGVPYDTERVTRAYKNKKGEMVPEQRIPIKRGQSYYTGTGGNKAHNSPDEVGAALDIDRAKNLKLSPTPQNVGNQIDQSSKQNKDMKVQNKPAPVNVQQNTTNVSNTSESSTPAKVDDRPAHKRK